MILFDPISAAAHGRREAQAAEVGPVNPILLRVGGTLGQDYLWFAVRVAGSIGNAGQRYNVG